MTTYTNPSATCDLCGRSIGKVFYDFSLPGDGRWANGCPPCFRAHKGKLGVGRGQKYVRSSDGSYVKDTTIEDKERKLPARKLTLIEDRRSFDLTGIDPTNAIDRTHLRAIGLSESEIDALPRSAAPVDDEIDPLGNW